MNLECTKKYSMLKNYDKLFINLCRNIWIAQCKINLNFIKNMKMQMKFKYHILFLFSMHSPGKRFNTSKKTTPVRLFLTALEQKLFAQIVIIF